MIHFIEDDLYDLGGDLVTDMGASLVSRIEAYLACYAKFAELYGP